MTTRELMTMQAPNSKDLTADGVRVPVRATFLGVKSVPWWALGNNSLYPRLVFYPDRIESVLFVRRVHDYSEIEQVEARTTIATRNLIFFWRGSLFTFTANIRNDEWRLWVLEILAKKGVTLADNARRLLPDNPS